MIRKILVWYVKSRKKFDDFRVLSFIFWFGNKKHTKLLCCSFCVWESERKILIPYNTQQQRVLVRGLSNEKSKVIIVHSTVKQSRMSCVVLILKREREMKVHERSTRNIHQVFLPAVSIVYNITRVLHSL